MLSCCLNRKLTESISCAIIPTTHIGIIKYIDEGGTMYRVLLACSIEYNTIILETMPVWGTKTDFEAAGKVYNGDDALHALRMCSYDMLITEMHLPGMDGMQLLRHVSQEKLCPLVVILSDTVDFQLVRECILYGAFDFLKKMPDTDTMMTMMNRAREQLLSRNHMQKIQEEDTYSLMEEEKIVRLLLNRNPDAISEFSSAITHIYHSEEAQSLQNDMQVKKLYSDIIFKVFSEFKWLSHYVSFDEYKKLDYLWVGSVQGFQDFFVRKIRHLYDRLSFLYPFTADQSLDSLLLYILSNPQMDLKLKTVAENVFLNYSYLSTNFSSKMGIRYNEYITRVKMERASFLLENTDMKIYEICSEVSYRDTNYFTRQFKKMYGQSPSEYKEALRGNDAWNYSCL